MEWMGTLFMVCTFIQIYVTNGLNEVEWGSQWKVDHLRHRLKNSSILSSASLSTDSGTENVTRAHPLSASLPRYTLPGLTITPNSPNFFTIASSSSHVLAPFANFANKNKPVLVGIYSTSHFRSAVVSISYEWAKRVELSLRSLGSSGERRSVVRKIAFKEEVWR